MHVARKLLKRIERVSETLPKETKVIVLSAALLHDIGHGPFSHAFEKVINVKHEKYMRSILLSDETEIGKLLSKYSGDINIPKLITDLYEGIFEPRFLSHLVNSQLDADRFDYLLRDCHATGTIYGNHDIMWLIQHLQINTTKQRCYLDRKAFSSAEQYIFSRYHMYRVVYFHKTVRAAEVMLRLLFQRYVYLVGSAGSKKAILDIAPNAPISVVRAFMGEMSISDYLALDDYAVFGFIKACEASKDDILRDLAMGLISRKLYKCIDATDVNQAQVGEFVSKVKSVMSKKGFDSDYLFAYDTPADTPYKPYDPDDENPATQIYIENTSGEQREISRISESVEELTKKYTLVRYYFPEKLRDEVSKVAVETLGKGSK